MREKVKLRYKEQQECRNGTEVSILTSSGAVYSTISVQRLEDLMVPKFC